MYDSDVFKRLTSDLSIQERKNLLERIKVPELEQQEIEDIDQLTNTKDLDIDMIYNKLSLFKKLVIFLKVLFQKKKKEEIVAADLLHTIENQLERIDENLVDLKNRVFLPDFYKELYQFYTVLMPVRKYFNFANTDRKKEFFLFLGTFEMEDFSREILVNTNPEKVTEDGNEDLLEIKKIVDSNFDDAFKFLYPDEKENMYMHAKILYNFTELIFFPLESILTYFREKNGLVMPCKMNDIRKYLFDFIDHINSLRHYPSDVLLEAVYLFSNNQDDDDEEVKVEEGLKHFFSLIGNVMTAVSHLKKDLHLIDLGRVICRRVNYTPKQLSGGEDWFTHFRAAWGEKIFAQFSVYKRQKAIKQTIAEAIIFLGTPGIPPLEHYQKKKWAEYWELRFCLSISFISYFLHNVLVEEMMPTIKIILINGEFYKEHNRDELVSSLNTVHQCSDRIRNLERDLSPHGVIGNEIEAYKKELIVENMLQKKIQTKLEQADSSAELILKDFLKSGKIICAVLKGILYGQMGGQYDTLSNIGDVNRKQRKNVMPLIDSVFVRIDNAVKICHNLFDIEND